MQQLHSTGEHLSQHMLCSSALLSVFFIIQAGLSQLDIPVAYLAPDEVVNHATGFAQLEFFQHFGNALGSVLQAGQNPFIGQSVGSKFSIGGISLNIHQSKTGSIPNLIGKIAGCFHTLPIEAHIIARSVTGNQHKAQGISAIFVDNLQRVDAIAQGFGHLAALTIAYQTMDEDLLKGNILHEFHTHNQHTCYPEENDVVAGYQHAGGIELLEERSLIRPAHGGEGPQSGAEPGVQRILILMDIGTATLGADSQVGTAGMHFATVIAVPNGDTVTPPNLAGNTPVANIIHPAGVGLGEALGHELGATIVNAIHSSLNQGLHFYEPLSRNKGLYNAAAALAVTNSMGMVFDFNKIAASFQISHNVLAAFLASLTFIFACFRSHFAIHANNNYAGQVMANAHLIVVGVVGRSDFYSAGTKFQINIAISDDGNNTTIGGQSQMLAYQMTIAGVSRVYSYSGIARDGLRTSGSNGQIGALFLHYGITEVPQMARIILVLNLDIGQSSIAVYAPVGDAGAFINEALFKQSAEHLAHGL